MVRLTVASALSSFLIASQAPASVISEAGWENDVEVLSLLQLQSKSQSQTSNIAEKERMMGVRSQSGWPAGGDGVCKLYEDPHVEETFANNGGNMRDFNNVPGVFPLAKTADGSIEFQAFNCPVARLSGRSGDDSEHRANRRFGFTEIQALAVKMGDDLIEIHYQPFDISKWRIMELKGLTGPQWKAKITQVCPGSTWGFRAVDQFDYYAYLNMWPDEMKSEYASNIGGWLPTLSVRPDARCLQQFFGVPVAPVMRINGVVVEELSEWFVSTGKQTVGNGYTLDATIYLDRMVYNLEPPGHEFNLVIMATTQVVKPILPPQQSLWETDISDVDSWRYYDPMMDVFLKVDLSLLQPDTGDGPGADGGQTLCGSTWTGGPNSAADSATNYPTTQIPFGDSLFSAEVVQQICDTCNWSPGDGRQRVDWDNSSPIEPLMPNCVVPPPVLEPPPAPPPPQVCEEFSEVPLADAENACSHLVQHAKQHSECIMDYCASGGNPEVPVMELEVAEEVDPLPECVGAECDPKTECADDMKLNLNAVKHNNLGGLGPDAGAHLLTYGNVARLDGVEVDLIVKVVDGGQYKAKKSEMNGVSGKFGQLALATGSAVNLEFSFVDAAVGTPVTISGLAFTVYDLDTGKKGKGAESVQVCGASSAMVSESTELDESLHAGCTKFTATVAGTGADNPESPDTLSKQQADRTATFSFASTDSFTASIEVTKGWGQRLFLFAFHPGIACLGA